MSRSLTTATAYIANQDTADEGWAYRLTFGAGPEVGDWLDSVDADGAASELEAIVTAHDGDWSAGVCEDDGTGGLVWTADP